MWNFGGPIISGAGQVLPYNLTVSPMVMLLMILSSVITWTGHPLSGWGGGGVGGPYWSQTPESGIGADPACRPVAYIKSIIIAAKVKQSYWAHKSNFYE